MNRLLKVLVVCAVMGLTGCGGPKWDKDDVAAKVRTGLDRKLREDGDSASVQDVDIVATSDVNRFKGAVRLNDGTTLAVSVDVDPNTGKMIWSTGP